MRTFLLVAICIFVIGISGFAACDKTPELSQQPDEKIFSQYFREVSIGKLSVEWEWGTQPERWDEKNFNQHFEKSDIFSLGDEIVLRDVHTFEDRRVEDFSVRYYDTQAKQFVGPSEVLPSLKTTLPGRRSAKTGTIVMIYRPDLPVGSYELKCYLGETLVAVLPFQVK